MTLTLPARVCQLHSRYTPVHLPERIFRRRNRCKDLPICRPHRPCPQGTARTAPHPGLRYRRCSHSDTSPQGTHRLGTATEFCSAVERLYQAGGGGGDQHFVRRHAEESYRESTGVREKVPRGLPGAPPVPPCARALVQPARCPRRSCSQRTPPCPARSKYYHILHPCWGWLPRTIG